MASAGYDEFHAGMIISPSSRAIVAIDDRLTDFESAESGTNIDIVAPHLIDPPRPSKKWIKGFITKVSKRIFEYVLLYCLNSHAAHPTLMLLVKAGAQ